MKALLLELLKRFGMNLVRDARDAIKVGPIPCNFREVQFIVRMKVRQKNFNVSYRPDTI
jgi:hypothetical protein